MEKRFRLKVLEMNSKTDEQLEKDRAVNNGRNYNNFNDPRGPQEDMYNYLSVVEVELTQEEYDKLRHGIITK